MRPLRLLKGIPYCNHRCSNVLFLIGKKRTKRSRHRGGASKRRPPLCTPPAASPVDTGKWSDFPVSNLKKPVSFCALNVQKPGHLWTLVGNAAGDSKGWCSAQRIKMNMIAGGNHTIIYASSKRPLSRFLWLLSCSVQESNILRTIYLQQGMLF